MFLLVFLIIIIPATIKVLFIIKILILILIWVLVIIDLVLFRVKVHIHHHILQPQQWHWSDQLVSVLLLKVGRHGRHFPLLKERRLRIVIARRMERLIMHVVTITKVRIARHKAIPCIHRKVLSKRILLLLLFGVIHAHVCELHLLLVSCIHIWP